MPTKYIVPLAKCAGNADGFFNICSDVVGGKTLTPCIPAIVLAGTLGPLGLSKEEHLYKYPVNYSYF